jgi:hypothetical protein
MESTAEILRQPPIQIIFAHQRILIILLFNLGQKGQFLKIEIDFQEFLSRYQK